MRSKLAGYNAVTAWIIALVPDVAVAWGMPRKGHRCSANKRNGVVVWHEVDERFAEDVHALLEHALRRAQVGDVVGDGKRTAGAVDSAVGVKEDGHGVDVALVDGARVALRQGAQALDVAQPRQVRIDRH